MRIKLITLTLLLFFPLLILASEEEGIINDSSKYAWGDKVGWINFHTDTGNVEIFDDSLTGYAWSENYGWINLSPTNGGVKNDSEGKLSGYAWNENLGWINFSGVTIDENGKFKGATKGEDSAFGQISFSCSSCNVKTDWRPESEREEDENEDEDDDEENVSDSGSNGQVLKDSDGDGIPDDQDFDDDEDGIPDTQDPDHPSYSGLPSQLFDINLEIDNPLIASIQDLIARVVFVSFGIEPTPVSLDFKIFNNQKEIVYQSEGQTVVETEKIFSKTFEDSTNLNPGNYTLALTTLYNGNVQDEFQTEFAIIESKKFNYNWWWFVLAGGLLIWRIEKKKGTKKQS